MVNATVRRHAADGAGERLLRPRQSMLQRRYHLMEMLRLERARFAKREAVLVAAIEAVTREIEGVKPQEVKDGERDGT